MNFRSVLICLSLPCCLFLFGCAQQTSTINDLLKYFKNSGLSVQAPPTLTDKEKEVVDKTRKAIKLVGGGQKRKLIESKTTIIDSVKVKIRRYIDASTAQVEYNNYLKTEERKKNRAKERNTPYNKSTYLLRKAFIIQIRHWTIKSLEDFKPTEVNVSKSSINKIKEAFKRFQ